MAVMGGLGGSNTAAVRSPGLTEVVVNDLADVADRLVDRVCELERLADRVFGPMPSDPSPEKVERTPNCVADVLQDRTRVLRGVADRLVSVTNRLGQLI